MDMWNRIHCHRHQIHSTTTFWDTIIKHLFGFKQICAQLFHHLLLSWWHHQIEIFSVLLALYGNSLNSPHKCQWCVALIFIYIIYIYMCLNKSLSKQSWFETPLHPLWCHCKCLGWEINIGTMVPVLSSLPPIPESCLELFSCGWTSTSCSTRQSKCRGKVYHSLGHANVQRIVLIPSFDVDTFIVNVSWSICVYHRFQKLICFDSLLAALSNPTIRCFLEF